MTVQFSHVFDLWRLWEYKLIMCVLWGLREFGLVMSSIYGVMVFLTNDISSLWGLWDFGLAMFLVYGGCGNLV